MKNKTQILEIVLQKSEGRVPAVYCPFTGVKICEEDCFREKNENEYPETVIAIWYGDESMFDTPLYQNDDFKLNYDNFKDAEDLNELALAIDNLNLENNFIIMEVSIYGNFPGDYGREIFLINVPNIEE
jgi:hypothetical protein